MATEIRVPTLGESVSEATIGKWFKKVGDAVKVDEPLCELETDKVTLEVNAPAAGVLAEIVARDGETVGVGALLGQIAEGAVAAKTSGAEEPKAVAQAAGGAFWPIGNFTAALRAGGDHRVRGSDRDNLRTRGSGFASSRYDDPRKRHRPARDQFQPR